MKGLDQPQGTAWGMWSTCTPADSDSKNVIHTITKNLSGVYYKPLYVTRQVLAGINYKFFCEVETASKDSHTFYSLLSIHEPLHGYSYITEKKTFDGTNLSTGWSYYEPITSITGKIFEEATEELPGVHYKPIAVSILVNQGFFYKFLCYSKGLYENTHTHITLITIHESISGSPLIQGIETIIK